MFLLRRTHECRARDVLQSGDAELGPGTVQGSKASLAPPENLRERAGWELRAERGGGVLRALWGRRGASGLTGPVCTLRDGFSVRAL